MFACCKGHSIRAYLDTFKMILTGAIYKANEVFASEKTDSFHLSSAIMLWETQS